MNALTPLAEFAGENAAMIARSIRHTSRDVETLLMSVILPVMLMLMFVYVFGGAIDTGSAYVNYVVPGILLLAAGFGSATTAVSVCSDMVSGVVDRFRSMPISGSAMLTGHVVASLARNLLSTAVVVGVGYAVGWRPAAGPLGWVAALALVALFIVAISWLSAALGLVAGSPESANAFTFVILFLPYLSSAFVPTSTMPAFLRGFADNQPVTPVIETLRGLLMGTPIGNSAQLAVAWCLLILLTSWAAAAVLFRRRTSR
jgi:ABC-2 type transport system permease protein